MSPHDPQAIEAGRGALAAASADPTHAAALDPALAAWRDVLQQEGIRLSGGAPLTPDHVLGLQPATLPNAAREERGIDRSALEDALRPGGQPRSILLRAVSSARALRAGPLAELAPCLLLVSGGLCSTPILLPFAEVANAAREEARESVDEADASDAFAELLLADAAEAARARRLGLRDALRGMTEDEAVLSPLGRAAITARRALGILRHGLATTVPLLSSALECSRPAAGDALERLVAVGLATEITGRGRDRVFVDALAWRALP